MLIIPQNIKVRWNGANKKHLIEKGYKFTKIGDEILVDVLDLSNGSKYSVYYICDYCIQIKSKEYYKYLTCRKPLAKDCCEDCVQLKAVESLNVNHGVSNNFQRKDVQEKIAQTNIVKIGYANPFDSPAIQSQIALTNMEKFGVDNPFKSPEVQAQIREKMYKNQSQMASNQQIYICNLFNGELNYPFSMTSLDIAFLDDKIDFEYDGGGHNLKVKLGYITQEEFDEKERKRDLFLKSNGWRIIRLISRNDYIPSDDILIKIMQYAIEYINTGHSWIHFDIDQSKVICSQYEKDYDYGTFRLIKDKDIESSDKVVNI